MPIGPDTIGQTECFFGEAACAREYVCGSVLLVNLNCVVIDK